MSKKKRLPTLKRTITFKQAWDLGEKTVGITILSALYGGIVWFVCNLALTTYYSTLGQMISSMFAEIGLALATSGLPVYFLCAIPFAFFSYQLVYAALNGQLGINQHGAILSTAKGLGYTLPYLGFALGLSFGSPIAVTVVSAIISGITMSELPEDFIRLFHPPPQMTKLPSRKLVDKQTNFGKLQSKPKNFTPLHNTHKKNEKNKHKHKHNQRDDKPAYRHSKHKSRSVRR